LGAGKDRQANAGGIKKVMDFEWFHFRYDAYGLLKKFGLHRLFNAAVCRALDAAKQSTKLTKNVGSYQSKRRA
jgi:hypothetical protein